MGSSGHHAQSRKTPRLGVCVVGLSADAGSHRCDLPERKVGAPVERRYVDVTTNESPVLRLRATKQVCSATGSSLSEKEEEGRTKFEPIFYL
jgi:hypothetical protein